MSDVSVVNDFEAESFCLLIPVLLGLEEVKRDLIDEMISDRLKR